MTTLEKRSYTDEDVETGLFALAYHRSGAKASRSTGIPERTLYDWKDRHPERFQRILEQRGETFAQIHDSMALRLAGETDATIDVFAKQRHELKAREAASAIRDLSVAQGVHEDKALTHRGQPSQIVRHENVEPILRKLNAIGLVVDSTATEVEAEPLPTQPGDCQLPAQDRTTKAREDSSSTDGPRTQQ